MTGPDLPLRRAAFSLVEVVVSLGVIAFAIVAILGVVPAGLSTGRSAQDETRAPQIAQDIFNSLASQAQTKGITSIDVNPVYDDVLPTSSNYWTPVGYPVDLTSPHEYDTLAADADARLVKLAGASAVMKYPYQVIVQVSPDPPGFDQGYATQVTVRVISPPMLNPNAAPTGNQSVRDFVRIISKY